MGEGFVLSIQGIRRNRYGIIYMNGENYILNSDDWILSLSERQNMKIDNFLGLFV